MTSVVDSCSSTMTVLSPRGGRHTVATCDRPPTRWAMDRSRPKPTRKPGLLPERFARGRVTGQEPAAAAVGSSGSTTPAVASCSGPCASRVTKGGTGGAGQSLPAVQSGCRRGVRTVWCAARPSEVSHTRDPLRRQRTSSRRPSASKVFMPVLNIRLTGASAASDRRRPPPRIGERGLSEDQLPRTRLQPVCQRAGAASTTSSTSGHRATQHRARRARHRHRPARSPRSRSTPPHWRCLSAPVGVGDLRVGWKPAEGHRHLGATQRPLQRTAEVARARKRSRPRRAYLTRVSAPRVCRRRSLGVRWRGGIRKA